MKGERTFWIATRGSALALAQANMIQAQCRAAFPERKFELRIIKTTGDHLQNASLSGEGEALPKGLFTKELEVALLERTADVAVHSLKDLPTELPEGLKLGAASRRADVRDVLIYRSDDRKDTGRGFGAGLAIGDLPPGAVVATSSTRRRAQLLFHNSALKTPDIRGNVLTRLQKLARTPAMDATVLALAGMTRLGYRVSAGGQLEGEAIPAGLLASILSTDIMLPCVGQGAIGLEVRDADEDAAAVCGSLNDTPTWQAVTAERAFLAAMGGGCQSPVAAHAERDGESLFMRVLSFADGPARRAEAGRAAREAAELGRQLAAEIKGPATAQAGHAVSGRIPPG